MSSSASLNREITSSAFTITAFPPAIASTVEGSSAPEHSSRAGATAGLSSSARYHGPVNPPRQHPHLRSVHGLPAEWLDAADQRAAERHCGRSQQWHPHGSGRFNAPLRGRFYAPRDALLTSVVNCPWTWTLVAADSRRPPTCGLHPASTHRSPVESPSLPRRHRRLCPTHSCPPDTV